VAVNGFTELSSRCFRVTIVEYSLDRVPTSSQQHVLLDDRRVFINHGRVTDPSPVNQTRNKFLLLVLVFGVLLERLHSGAIFNVEAVHSAALVSNEELAVPVIHTHAGNVFRRGVSEHTLQSTVDCIPYLDASGMSGNESVEYGVVKNAAASLVISQVVVCRLIIIVEFHASATSNDSLWRLSHCETVYFIQRAVESLYGSKGTHIPDSEHTGDISRDDLVSSLHPFDSYQTVVMALE